MTRTELDEVKSVVYGVCCGDYRACRELETRFGHLVEDDRWHDLAVEPIPNEGVVLVVLPEERFGSRLCVATKRNSITIIGGNFDFDMPKILRWRPLAEPEDAEERSRL